MHEIHSVGLSRWRCTEGTLIEPEFLSKLLICIVSSGDPSFGKVQENYRVTLSVAVRLVVPVAAVMMLVRVAVCVSVVIVNVAVVAPAGTVTDAGTLATVVVALVSVTTTASVAGPVSVTVPVLLVPPFTDVGFNVKADTNRTALTVIDADFATPR